MAYSNIKDPSAHFQTALYAGNNTTDHNITNDGNSDLQPDFVWIKQRNSDNPHVLHDTSRGFNGAGLGYNLQTNSTAVEGTNGAFESFNTNGFGVGGTNVASGAYNLSGSNYVAWQWKANGGTTSSNSDGSVTSTVQANTDAGFSIVTFDSASSGNFSVGHGLGVQPAMIITKNREGTGQWYCWHKSLTGGDSNTSYLISLNRTDEESSYANAWGAGVTSSVFGMQSGNTATASNDYVAWCFAEKQGYSKFGSYIGNGNTNGPFVYTGFKPALVVVKRSIVAGSTAYGNWLMYDNKRGAYNLNDEYFYANNNAAEATSTTAGYDFLSNGFKVRNTYNDGNVSGNTYIYMAFAETPFVAGGVPTTAR
jgi:hypothetical protein